MNENIIPWGLRTQWKQETFKKTQAFLGRYYLNAVGHKIYLIAAKEVLDYALQSLHEGLSYHGEGSLHGSFFQDLCLALNTVTGGIW